MHDIINDDDDDDVMQHVMSFFLRVFLTHQRFILNVLLLVRGVAFNTV